ncbi:MAG: diaminopimelate epimerase, partial [Candidatus Omnitrophota bacterium]|nr:diaminopimelate epimerase [Candidatus Omnitrophota bacterium]
NGARRVALYMSRQKILKIETAAGIIEAQLNGDNVKIKLTEPKDIKLDISIKVNNRGLVVNFINTGVPHTVVFTEGLEKIDVFNLGRQVREHKKFAPAGTNVDFVEVLNNNSIEVRTYERGVEEETLACGTGVAAAALIADYKLRAANFDKKINVKTRSGEVLKVYFERVGASFKNIWLEGKARIVYKGEYYV